MAYDCFLFRKIVLLAKISLTVYLEPIAYSGRVFEGGERDDRIGLIGGGPSAEMSGVVVQPSSRTPTGNPASSHLSSTTLPRSSS
jgi:hypothetical protein